MKKLFPTFAKASNYRGATQNGGRLSARQTAALRNEVLERDVYRCAYCGFRSHEYQTINYIDGDSSNNRIGNLTTACAMCNLILNTPIGCQIEGIVELYQSSEYDQNRIVQITREMRSKGKGDDEIKRFLGLRDKAPFRMNREYLKGLYAFVTSWKGSRGDFEEALSNGYGH